MSHTKIEALSRPSKYPAPGRLYGACAVFLGVFVFSLSVQAWHEATRQAEQRQQALAATTKATSESPAGTAENAMEWRPTDRYLTRWQLLQLTTPATLAAIVSLFFARSDGTTIVPPPPRFDTKFVTETTGLPLLASLFPNSAKVRPPRVKHRAEFVRWTVFTSEALVCSALIIAGIAAITRPPIGRQLLANPFHGYSQAVELARLQVTATVERFVRNPGSNGNSR